MEKRELTEEKAIEIAKPVVREAANRIAEKRYKDVEEIVEFDHFSPENLKNIIEGQMQENAIPYPDKVDEDDLIADENIFCEEIYEDGKKFRISYQFAENEEEDMIYLEIEFAFTDNDEVKAKMMITEDMAVEMAKTDLKKIVNLIADQRYGEIAQIAEMGELSGEKIKEIIEGYLEENDMPCHIDYFSDKAYYDMYDNEVNGGIYDNGKGIWIEYHLYSDGEDTGLVLQADFLFKDGSNALKPVICGMDVC